MRFPAALLSMLTLSSSCWAGYFFADDFSTLRPSVWDLHPHGYPPPVFTASGGIVRLGNPHAFSLDFPVMYSRRRVFPTVGDYIVEIAFQFPVRRINGVGFRALTAGPPYYAALQFWQGLHPLVVRFGNERVTLPSSSRRRLIRYEIVGSTVAAFLDDEILGSSTLVHGRPATVFFGHPTIGEILGVPGSGPGRVDANGVVIRRWWGRSRWTNLALDYFRVWQIPPRHRPKYLWDDFRTFRGDLWEARWHGYPVPFARVDRGRLILGRPDVVTLDFPVFFSRGIVLPQTLDYDLEIAFQYTAIAINGVGFGALTAGPVFSRMLGFWQDAIRPLHIRVGNKVVRLYRTTEPQVLRYEVRGSRVAAYLNGVFLADGVLSAGRPAIVFFGHPTVGEPFGLPVIAGYADARGIIRRRWWGVNRWTNLAIDYVRVSVVPEPASAFLFAIALAGLLVRRHLRRRSTAHEIIRRA